MMGKLIKHELNATARLVLPFLAVSALSGIFFSLLWEKGGSMILLRDIVGAVMGIALTGLCVIGLAIIIGRFYRNVMTDTGYLTMTLPVNAHEFVLAELIMCLLWGVITAVVLFAAFLLPGINFADLARTETLESIKQVFRAVFREPSAFLIVIEAVIALILAFFLYCLRFYGAMAVGQLADSRRILLSIAAYVLWGIVIVLLFLYALKGWGDLMSFDEYTMSRAAGALGLFDLTLLMIDAVLYFPTVLLIGRKLNLR